METIKNYLETMFANLPNTEEVLKAKDELGQMMEDKYNELRADGKSENEAVGTVISEFGNLNDLAEDLGLEKVMKEKEKKENLPEKRILNVDEVKRFITDKGTEGFMIALGVFFCIISLIPIIVLSTVFDNTVMEDTMSLVGVIGMIFLIMAGVLLFVFAGTRAGKWDYLKTQRVAIDYATAKYLGEERDRSALVYSALMTIGIALCALCWVPVAIFDGINERMMKISGPYPFEIENLVGTSLFALLAIGVFLIILAAKQRSRYDFLLGINEEGTVSGDYRKGDGKVEYENKTLAAFMSVYWPIITCVYLIISFLTFDWHITWIIWPVAAIAKSVIDACLGKRR